LTPANGRDAVAVPTVTVGETTVPIVVAPLLTVNVTDPEPTAGPEAGTTDAVSVTEESA
jgi:hypothetical protein